MVKFKVGDLVQAIDVEGVTDELNTISKYVVLKLYGTGIYVKNDLGSSSTGYYYTRFKLADHTLTPEEVLQYFKEGRQHELEVSSKCSVGGWFPLQPNEIMYIDQIFKRTWRIKSSVPKTIDYYGIEIPKPVTKAEAEAEGLATVYRPQLVADFTCWCASVDSMGGCNVYFRTESEALQVAEVLLKPFK